MIPFSDCLGSLRFRGPDARKFKVIYADGGAITTNIDLKKGVVEAVQEDSGFRFDLCDELGSMGAMSWSRMCELMALLDKVYVTDHDKEEGYRNVKDNRPWRTIYRVGDYRLPKMNPDGTIGDVEIKACPCYNCGFLFPFDAIQIEHVKPQARGKDQAVIKVMRHMGLTEAPGKGGFYVKNNEVFRRGMRLPINSHLGEALNPKGNRRGAAAAVTVADDWETYQRYTLTIEGMIFLSVVCGMRSLPEVQQACMHSFVNLRPFCSTCNGKKTGNLTKKIGAMAWRHLG